MVVPLRRKQAATSSTESQQVDRRSLFNCWRRNWRFHRWGCAATCSAEVEGAPGPCHSASTRRGGVSGDTPASTGRPGQELYLRSGATWIAIGAGWEKACAGMSIAVSPPAQQAQKASPRRLVTGPGLFTPLLVAHRGKICPAMGLWDWEEACTFRSTIHDCLAGSLDRKGQRTLNQRGTTASRSPGRSAGVVRGGRRPI